MKPVHLALVLCLSGAFAPPVLAQTAAPDGDGQDVEQGFSLMEEGAKLLLRGLMAEMEPALDEMGTALSELEPALKDLQPRLLEFLALVDDLTNYQPPERLENGDILIRRKPGAPPAPPLPVPPDSADSTPQTDL